jgi:hypothetical protein
MVEDSEEGEGDGDSVSEEALLPGLMSAWGEEDYRGAGTSSVEPRERLSRRFTPHIIVPGSRHMTEERHILEL